MVTNNKTHTTNGIQRLHEKIDAMARFLDLDKYIKGDKNSLKQIRSYYRINMWAYRRYHSHDGFMHFRISDDGQSFTDKDTYRQPDSISEHIRDGHRVLEFGFGQGSNIFYLARRHPKATFYGIDLSPMRKKDIPANVHLYRADYCQLPQFDDNSIDVMYAIETIVHNSDKERIYREVERVLKPGGCMIVYDYALGAPFESYDEHIQKAIALLSKGGASAIIESGDELKRHYTNCGLVVESQTDYTTNIRPDLKALERKAANILERPWKARLMFKLLPDQFVTNIILGYLGYDFSNTDVLSYQEWVLRKPVKQEGARQQ